MMSLTRIQDMLRVGRAMDCQRAEGLMSDFIDSMTTPEEAAELEAHVSVCQTCRRQLQGYVSLRNFMACADLPKVPEDLELEARIRLSHVRTADLGIRINAFFQNLLRPHALPAVTGILATGLCFAFLLTSFSSSLRFDRRDMDVSTIWIQTGPRMADSLLRQLAELELDQVTVDLAIDRQGRAFSSVILNGSNDPTVDRWLRDIVLLGEFHPATLYGQPIPSRLVLSFVGVRSSPLV